MSEGGPGEAGAAASPASDEPRPRFDSSDGETPGDAQSPSPTPPAQGPAVSASASETQSPPAAHPTRPQSPPAQASASVPQGHPVPPAHSTAAAAPAPNPDPKSAVEPGTSSSSSSEPHDDAADRSASSASAAAAPARTPPGTADDSPASPLEPPDASLGTRDRSGAERMAECCASATTSLQLLTNALALLRDMALCPDALGPCDGLLRALLGLVAGLAALPAADVLVQNALVVLAALLPLQTRAHADKICAGALNEDAGCSSDPGLPEGVPSEARREREGGGGSTVGLSRWPALCTVPAPLSTNGVALACAGQDGIIAKGLPQNRSLFVPSASADCPPVCV